MEYKVIGYYKRNNDLFVKLINNDNNEFLSNGVYIWRCKENKLNKLTEISKKEFNKDKFLNYWNNNLKENTISF